MVLQFSCGPRKLAEPLADGKNVTVYTVGKAAGERALVAMCLLFLFDMDSTVRQAMYRSSQPLPHHEMPCSRRDFLTRSGGGIGLLALLSLMERDGHAAAGAHTPGSPNAPHFPASAKSVIWLFLDGGPSHIDLFDPKPQLSRLDGQPLPPSFKRPVTAMGRTAHTPLLGSKRTFKRHGQSGM